MKKDYKPLKDITCVVCQKKEPVYDITGCPILLNTSLGYIHANCQIYLSKLLKRLKFKEETKTILYKKL